MTTIINNEKMTTSHPRFESQFNEIQARKAAMVQERVKKMQFAKGHRQVLKAGDLVNTNNVRLNNYVTDLAATGTDNMDEFKAAMAAPTITVGDKKGSYWELPYGTRRRNTMKKSSERAMPKESFLESNEKSYNTTMRDDSIPLTEQNKLALKNTVGNNWGDVFEFATEAQAYLREVAMLDREIRWKDLITADSSFDSGNVTASTDWSVASADILEEIWDNDSTVQSKTGAMQNTRVISHDVWLAIKKAPDFLDRITEGRMLGMQNVKDVNLAIFEGLTNSVVFVNEVTVNDSEFGEDDNIGWLFPDAFVSFYNPVSSGVMVTAHHACFACDGIMNFNQEGIRTDMITTRETERNTDKYIIESFDDYQLISKEYGWKISSVTT